MAIKSRVLVVDDHEANRAAFSALLEQEHSVVAASSGAQALELTLKEEYAVILLDVHMPALDGFETAELLRKRKGTRDTPIIFMSAYDHNVLEIKKGYVAGATEFLSSPVDEDLLRFKVDAYVKLYLRQQALKFQIHHLTRVVEAIKVEARRRLNDQETALKGRIDELEAIISELTKEMPAASC